MHDLNLLELKALPFQAQISYTALDGSKYLRVISKQLEISNDRKELEAKADFNLLS